MPPTSVIHHELCIVTWQDQANNETPNCFQMHIMFWTEKMCKFTRMRIFCKAQIRFLQQIQICRNVHVAPIFGSRGMFWRPFPLSFRNYAGKYVSKVWPFMQCNTRSGRKRRDRERGRKIERERERGVQ
jgi:hypothetical protein